MKLEAVNRLKNAAELLYSTPFNSRHFWSHSGNRDQCPRCSKLLVVNICLRNLCGMRRHLEHNIWFFLDVVNVRKRYARVSYTPLRCWHSQSWKWRNGAFMREKCETLLWVCQVWTIHCTSVNLTTLHAHSWLRSHFRWSGGYLLRQGMFSLQINVLFRHSHGSIF